VICAGGNKLLINTYVSVKVRSHTETTPYHVMLSTIVCGASRVAFCACVCVGGAGGGGGGERREGGRGGLVGYILTYSEEETVNGGRRGGGKGEGGGGQDSLLSMGPHGNSVQSNFDMRGLKRKEACKREVLCVLTRFTGRMCNF
jgi:hypothetical protein